MSLTLTNQTATTPHHGFDFGNCYTITKHGLIIHHQQETIGDELIHRQGDRWDFFGTLYTQTSGGFLTTFEHGSHSSLSVGFLQEMLATDSGKKGIVFRGRHVGWLKKDLGDIYVSGSALRVIIEESGMPLWFAAEHATFHSQEFLEAVIANKIEVCDHTLLEMIKGVLDEMNAGGWGDDDETPYCVLGATDRALASLIQQHVDDAGMNREDLASASGLSEQDINFLLDGEAAFTVGEVMAISQSLGLKCSELVTQAETLADAEVAS